MFLLFVALLWHSLCHICIINRKFSLYAQYNVIGSFVVKLNAAWRVKLFVDMLIGNHSRKNAYYNMVKARTKYNRC